MFEMHFQIFEIQNVDNVEMLKKMKYLYQKTNLKCEKINFITCFSVYGVKYRYFIN